VYDIRLLKGARDVLGGFAPTFYFGDRLGEMNKLVIAERVREIAAEAAGKNNLELVHVDVIGTVKSPTVRVFIDKPGGVSVGDCTTVSRQMEAVLDAEDFISSTYVLEVSSPGLERELYSLKDFEKFSGNPARVRTHEPINGQRNFRGRIKDIDGENIIFEDKTNGEVSFPYNLVAKANLEIDLDEVFKRGK
jgi:ribosome maturation factor RimP